ncbi:uncharacterized protein zgc:113184 isoform X1 [Melanotaenia boesemani]|uniref:uncharacterized protein zgc:113184 isoform X1 n=1 Tax=Melanotaenia boesemani TaxID=1250792 RepID=UPI001C050952|nr:uncharacterized protein zgc:113184 isoform X1 [Melanotaenia boesemani]XP_041834089.1 uncharacterized protein zgc:113184 isoform X1 [Melanotaenia boesemani]XP_041834094.1 uncharacterized protein zgc:113184 isoform X1 [Melanotaenia boesemani]XP_041834097.1 uncharacterized protein zgc:113184 isoform X1 [Melanotaenia boesemani]
MEEAYAELYQEFIRLRSLCLRQAALLHQLTTALQKQHGASVPNGEGNEMISIPVQCTNEMPVCLYKTCDADHLSKNGATASCLLAENMSKLSVDEPFQRWQDLKAEKIDPFMLTLESSKHHGGSSCKSKTPGQNRPGEDRTLFNVRMPVTDGTSLTGDLLSCSGGALLSDVALQSHVCEFCHAVFPGDTTTGGEFLRHLHTHVT